MPLFTADNAVEMGRRSAEIKKQRKEHPPAPPAAPVVIEQPTDDFTGSRLARTREQMVKLDGMIADCEDAKELKALCDALARLSEIERVLAGRPLPGALRPGREKRRTPQGAAYEPVPLALITPDSAQATG
jgi:hypothetical protein